MSGEKVACCFARSQTCRSGLLFFALVFFLSSRPCFPRPWLSSAASPAGNGDATLAGSAHCGSRGRRLGPDLPRLLASCSEKNACFASGPRSVRGAVCAPRRKGRSAGRTSGKKTGGKCRVLCRRRYWLLEGRCSVGPRGDSRDSFCGGRWALTRFSLLRADG